MEVFAKVVEILHEEGLVRGRKIGVHASNLKANAAMRSIRRKIDGKWYTAYLRKPAKASGREKTSQEESARFDRNRLDKRCSHQDWENPHDPDEELLQRINHVFVTLGDTLKPKFPETTAFQIS